MRSADESIGAPAIPAVFPPRLERLQMKYMNPVVAPLAGRVPFFAVVHHRGRKSNRRYRTTVRAFIKGSTLSIVLVHGETDWVKNVMAAKEAHVGMTRRTLHVVEPRILPAGSRNESLPFATRIFLRRSAVFVAKIA